MTLSLSLDTQLQAITDLCRSITGISQASNYDEWPDSPPGLFNRAKAMHLTGYPEEDAWSYRRLGIDMNEFELVVPLYTVVLSSAQIKRSRSWVEPYFDRYPALFAANMQLSGAITNGVAMYTGGRIVRSIPNYDAFDGAYMIRHSLEIHSKGHVEQSP